MATKQEPRAFVLIVTPFTARDRLDEPALRQHLRRMAAAGLGVYLGSPGAGEGQFLTLREMRRLFEIGGEELRGKVPVYATGIWPRTAKSLVEVAQAAADAGLDGINLYPLDGGHGMKPMPVELEQYFDDVLSNIKLPALIAHHAAAGYPVPVTTLTRLVARHDHVIGINVSTYDVSYLAEVIRALGARVAVYSGGPALTLANLALGGDGFLDAVPNVAPRLCASVIEHYRSGNLTKMGESFGKVIQLNQILSMFPQPPARALKLAMKLLGQPGGGTVRKPFVLPRGAPVRAMAHALRAFDVPAAEANA